MTKGKMILTIAIVGILSVCIGSLEAKGSTFKIKRIKQHDIGGRFKSPGTLTDSNTGKVYYYVVNAGKLFIAEISTKGAINLTSKTTKPVTLSGMTEVKPADYGYSTGAKFYTANLYFSKSGKLIMLFSLGKADGQEDLLIVEDALSLKQIVKKYEDINISSPIKLLEHDDKMYLLFMSESGSDFLKFKIASNSLGNEKEKITVLKDIKISDVSFSNFENTLFWSQAVSSKGEVTFDAGLGISADKGIYYLKDVLGKSALTNVPVDTTSSKRLGVYKTNGDYISRSVVPTWFVRKSGEVVMALRAPNFRLALVQDVFGTSPKWSELNVQHGAVQDLNDLSGPFSVFINGSAARFIEASDEKLHLAVISSAETLSLVQDIDSSQQIEELDFKGKTLKHDTVYFSNPISLIERPADGKIFLATSFEHTIVFVADLLNKSTREIVEKVTNYPKETPQGFIYQDDVHFCYSDDGGFVDIYTVK